MKKWTMLALAAALLWGGTAGVRAGGGGTNFDLQLEVSASSMKGASFTAPESGDYTFTVVSGAYCYLPSAEATSPFSGWLTQLEIHTGTVPWGAQDEWGKHPLEAVGNVGDVTHYPTSVEAAKMGKGTMSTMYLSKGSVVTLLVSDGSDFYTDNLGSVKVRVTSGTAPAVAVEPERVAAPTGAAAPAAVKPAGGPEGDKGTTFRLDGPGMP